MAWCFSLSWNVENEAFLNTYFLSQRTFAAPSICTSIIINLYLNETINSVAIFNTKNSAWVLDYQMIGAELKYKITPVWDLLVAIYFAWSESTKQLTWTVFLIGFGEFCGISSPASTYKSFNDWTLLCIYWSLVTHW